MWWPLPAPASGGGRRRPGAVVWLVLLDGGVSESGQQVDVLAEGEGVVAPLAVGAAVGVDVERDLDLAVVDLAVDGAFDVHGFLLGLELLGDVFGGRGDVVEPMDFVLFDAGDVAAGVEFGVAALL